MPLDRLGLGQERAFSRITYENFKCLCDKYDILAQDTYESTDYFRFKSIIEVLTQRKQDGCAFLEKTELQILAEWRRVKKVRELTQAAFSVYGDRHHYVEAIEKLTELEGVSFPIATLILAEYDPANIPYFTEGMYRWLREDDARGGIWDRKIDYIMKQYKVLIEKVAQLRGRLKQQSGAEITAIDVEKVGRQINDRAQERRKNAVDNEDDDFLLRPPGPWSAKKRKLGPPLRDEERVSKHPPKRTLIRPAPHGVPVGENARF